MGISIVTGGSGFIGSHLVKALSDRGEKVYIFDVKKPHAFPPNVTWYNCDINHLPNWHWGEATFYHLAALADIIPSIERPLEYYDTNVTGTLSVLEYARMAGCKKFVYAASASCYGDSILAPTREDAACIARYPYALTKYLGEQLVMHWSKVYGIPAISLRLFNVYGSRSCSNGTYGAMFGTFLAQMANNKPVTIVGDGAQSRDFIYVSDVVEAFIHAADSDVTGIFNAGTGKPVSINRIVELLGAKESVNIPKRPGEPDVTCANISKIKRELGWEPKVSIEEGVSMLLEGLHEYKNAPLWNPETIADQTQEWFRRLG